MSGSHPSEYAVLGSALMDNSLLRGPLASLSVRDFSAGLNRAIFGAMLQLSEDGQSFDAMLLAEVLKRQGHFKNGDGILFLDGLTDGVVPTPDRVGWHAKRIREQAQLWRLKSFCETFQRESSELTANPAQLVEKFARRSAALCAEVKDVEAEVGDGLICLRDVQAQKVDWLWNNRIPRGTVCMLDGDPGLGKSTLALDLAARVTTGRAMPFEESGGSPSGVIFLSSEDLLAQTIRPRLDMAGGDPSRVFAFDPSTDVAPLTFPDDIARLESMISSRGVSLLVVDPLVAYLGQEISSHKDQDVRRALAPLQRMAERLNCACIGIRHLNKSAGGNVLYRGGGSIAIVGAARAAYLVASDPDDPQSRVFAPIKANLAPPTVSLRFQVVNPEGSDVPKIVWRGTSERSPSELVAQSTSEEDKSALEDAVDFLHEILWDGARPTKYVQLEAKKRGLAWRTIKRAKPKAGVKSRPPEAFQGEWLLELQSGPKLSSVDQTKKYRPH